MCGSIAREKSTIFINQIKFKCRYRFHQIMTLPNSFSGKGGTNKISRVVLAPFSQTIGFLLRTPWQAKSAQINVLAKSQFDESCVDHLKMKFYFYFFLIRAQCYKTFFGRYLRIFVISYSDCPWQAFAV
jgi:hypothetical protein